ncbi:hypothetical protein LIER_38237 [Lithospermum erythrorhizon]|uniref:Uncharacterized protein n=1 Tax=Lithospermum erythrorhizon TaxID=34254 RepID=A0AAV3PX25_LITER
MVAITCILGMPEVTTHRKYLRLLTSLGTLKKDFYSSLITRVKPRSRVGNPDYSPRQEKKFLLSQCYKLFPTILCYISCCLYMCATRSILSSQTIGGDPQSKRNQYVGLLGLSYAIQKLMGGSASGTSGCSIWLCSANRHGASLQIRIVNLSVSTRPSIFHKEHSGKIYSKSEIY